MPALFFFFQAEDGIRDDLVTGVQTCALPISSNGATSASMIAPHTQITANARMGHCTRGRPGSAVIEVGATSQVLRGAGAEHSADAAAEIGRASCRERVEIAGGAASWKKHT